eukprot:GHVL01004575.1.p1 GENE.GHVL01004575.1~~GHVL01004575.1.p1  ORF type:complete len:258 (+),score=16.72 GHVL01004575.1:83-856(+)
MWNIRCQAITYSVLVLCIFKYVECAVKIVGSRDDQLNLIGGNTTTTISHTEDLLSFTRDQSTPLFNLNSTLLSFSTTLQLDGGLELTSGKESEDEESGPWALLSLDTFDSPASKWSQQERSFCGTSSDMFLGGHCKFASTTTAREWTDLPKHSIVRITGRIHFFDEWTGEAVHISIEGAKMWSHSHNWCPQIMTYICHNSGINSCGHDYPDKLSVYFDITYPHSSLKLKLAIGSTLNENIDPCDASWGVDDVAMYVR